MNKERKNTIEQNEISKIYTFKLGGYSQKVLVEGKRKDLPIVITLHGGPGTPIPFSVGCRGLFPMFTDHFIMVYWDQLGCGINDYKIDDSFQIQTFVDMTCDLVSEIRMLFPNHPIYFFASSWGSVLSALAAESVPDQIGGVVVCGQIIKDIFFHEEVFHTLEASKIPQKKLKVLKNANPETATPKELQLMSSCLTKYTDAYYNPNGKKAPMLPIIKGLLTSPDYNLKDFKAVMVNGYRGNRSLWKELLKINLTQTLSHITVPYVILQGDTDIVASTQTVKQVVSNAGNSNLKYEIVEDTGHFPGEDMMNAVLEKLKLYKGVANI